MVQMVKKLFWFLMFGIVVNGFTQQAKNLELIGHLYTVYDPVSIFVNDNLVFLAAHANGLYIIDVSNPNDPQEIANFSRRWVEDVYVSGNYVYVAYSSGLGIVDISDPAKPKELGYAETRGHPHGIFVSENYVYLACEATVLGNSWQGLYIFDVINPSNPVKIGYYPNSGKTERDIYVFNNYAFIASGGDGLIIINVSDPTNPQWAGNYNVSNFAAGVFVQEVYAYIANGNDGLSIINISDPTKPQETGSYDTPNFASRVFANRDYVYVVDELGGLRIINLTNPVNPQEVAYYNTQFAEDVFVDSQYVYLTDRYNGLYILKFTPSGQLTFSATQLNLGSVNVGSQQQQTISVTNSGASDVMVSSAYINGNDSAEFSLVSGVAPFSLAPSQSRDMVIEFTPQSPGSKLAYLIIESNAPSSPDTVVLKGTGVERPALYAKLDPYYQTLSK